MGSRAVAQSFAARALTLLKSGGPAARLPLSSFTGKVRGNDYNRCLSVTRREFVDFVVDWRLRVEPASNHPETAAAASTSCSPVQVGRTLDRSNMRPERGPAHTESIARDDFDVPSSPDDWRLAARSRVNVLLVGATSPNDLGALLAAPDSRPVFIWRPGSRLDLPDEALDGLLVLPDVERLRPEDQRRLFDWLQDSSRRIRVVSTTRIRLISLVERANS